MTNDKAPSDQWLTRQTLLYRVKSQSDDNAWSDFESYYSAYIYNILRHMGLKPEDAQDVSQQVLLKLWKHLPDFDLDSSRGKFRSWLATVVRNQARDFYKSRPHSNHESIDLLKESTSQSEFEKIVNSEWQKYALEKAWEIIKDEFEEKTLNAFQMASSGMSIKEVSEKLGLNEASVYSFKSRVKERLKKEVRKLNYEYG